MTRVWSGWRAALRRGPRASACALLAAALLSGFLLARSLGAGPVPESNAGFDGPARATDVDRPVKASDDASGAPRPQGAAQAPRGSGPPRVSTGRSDALGRDVTIACMSCHASLEPNPSTRDGAALTEFHQGLATAHGAMACLSCHDRRDYDRLQRADGTALDFADAQQLCSQCHAPQARDWEHGAHGGMTGHWDRTRGPRQRKSCTDCHDAHAPAFPKMRPTFFPQDRFLDTTHD